MAIADIAGGIGDSLEELVKRRLFQQMQAAQIQHLQAQDLTDQARVGLEGRRVGQGDRSLDQSAAQFDARLGLDKGEFDFKKQVYGEGAPARAADLAHTTAETGELLRKPASEEIARNFTTGRDKTQAGYRLGEIGLQGRNALAVSQARPAPTMVVPSGETDAATGAQTMKVVPKVAGTTFAKPEPTNASLETRLQSAKAVTQTGNDIIATLKDPRVAAMLGPAMSRYNSVADFVGAPPPEFAKLAGQIESYSLANMGVHGMRSANGAEAIKQTVGANRHTPESMIAVLEGLNGFANHLLENNHRGAGGIIRARDSQGNLHEAPAGTTLPPGWVLEK